MSFVTNNINAVNSNTVLNSLSNYKVNFFYFKHKKQIKKVFSPIIFKNIFFWENFDSIFNNKLLIKNIKKFFYFRLVYFFFKKKLYHIFWLFKANLKNKHNRIFIFNLFRIFKFTNYFFNKVFLFNFISYFFFKKNYFFNYNNFGFIGFLNSSSIFYTRLHFKRILSIQDLSQPKHSLKFANSNLYFYQKKYCKFFRFKSKPPRTNSKFYDLKYIRWHQHYILNNRKHFSNKASSRLKFKNNKYLEFLDKYYYNRRKPKNYYSFEFRNSSWSKYKNKNNKYHKYANVSSFYSSKNKYTSTTTNRLLPSKQKIKEKNKKKALTFLNSIANISKHQKSKLYLINFNFANYFVLDYLFYFFNNFSYQFNFVSFDILVLNYVNKFFFFWLSFLKDSNKILKIKEKNKKKKKNNNLSYLSIFFVKTKYYNSNNFLTKYNVTKFYKYIFNDLFYNNFYRYRILHFIKKEKYFIFCNQVNIIMHINFLTNNYFNNNYFSIYNTLNNKKMYFNYFTFWQSLPFYNLNIYLKNNFYNVYLKNLLFSYKNNYAILFNLSISNYFLTKPNLLKNNTNIYNCITYNFIKYNVFNYNKLLFNTNIFKKKINTFLSLSDKLSANILVKLNLIKKFYKVKRYDSYAIPFLKRNIYRFWKYSSSFWNKFFYRNRNYYAKFYVRLLSIKKSFKFLLFINSNFKQSLILKKKNMSIFAFKKFHYYLFSINRLFLILSGSTFLFNFFNFFALLNNNLLNLSILKFRLPFKKVYIYLKYVILRKKNLLSFKNSSFLKTKLAAYKYLFLAKSKFIKFKNNFRNFIKNNKTYFQKSVLKSRFFIYSSKSLYGFNFLKKINLLFFEINSDIEDYFAYHLNMSYWSEYLIFLLAKLDLLKIQHNISDINNNFYNNYYYKYKQLFFFFYNKEINSSLLDSFNFSLFLYNKNYNWFFFNYFWKFYFINYIISPFKLDCKIANNTLLERDFLLYAFNNNNSLNFNSDIFNTFNFFNFKNMSKFNKTYVIIKFILKKKLSFFDKSFWNKLIYVKFKKSTLLKRVGKYYPKLNAFSKYLSFNFFNRKKKWRKRYLINVRNYSYLKNINQRKLLLLNKLVILVINIQLNNTFITLTDIFGNVLLKASAGLLGIKGPKRSTPVATEEITNYVCQFILKNNYKFLMLRLNGVLQTRKMKSAIKAISNYINDFIILRAYNYTPKAHNGIRFKKRKRL